MTYLERARELRDELIANRRYLHRHAEVGLHLPKTKEFILKKLAEDGIDGSACGEGVVALLGRPGKKILLRADMDALPMAEESGLDFACPTGTEAHTCGHDCHAAMLLTAARMLKEREDTLQGTVKLMFQPAEETFEGARNMMEHGLLENPRPDAALAYHVLPGKLPIGLFAYNDKSALMASVDGFRITIHGKGAHGALPHQSVDPISIGVHIHLALQSLIARECPPNQMGVLTIGQFSAGSAANIIPETAIISGIMRTLNPATRARAKEDFKQIVNGIAAAMDVEAEIDMRDGYAASVNDEAMTQLMRGAAEKLLGSENVRTTPSASLGTEDFGYFLQEAPGCYYSLGAGNPEKG